MFPFAASLEFCLLAGEDAGASMFLAAGARRHKRGHHLGVLIELGGLDNRASRTILGALSVNDILAMIPLAGRGWGRRLGA